MVINFQFAMVSNSNWFSLSIAVNGFIYFNKLIILNIEHLNLSVKLQVCVWTASSYSNVHQSCILFAALKAKEGEVRVIIFLEAALKRRSYSLVLLPQNEILRTKLVFFSLVADNLEKHHIRQIELLGVCVCVYVLMVT